MKCCSRRSDPSLPEMSFSSACLVVLQLFHSALSCKLSECRSDFSLTLKNKYSKYPKTSFLWIVNVVGRVQVEKSPEWCKTSHFSFYKHLTPLCAWDQLSSYYLMFPNTMAALGQLLSSVRLRQTWETFITHLLGEQCLQAIKWLGDWTVWQLLQRGWH